MCGSGGKWYAARRWRVAMLANVGFVLALGARCNFGGVRAMHEDKRITIDLPAIMQASASNFGVVQGAFYLGYVLMHLPAAFSVASGAAHRIFGVCVGASCLLSMALMCALTVSNPWPAMLVCFVQGGCQGFMYPSMHQMWHYWAPPLERSRLTTTAFVGAYLGVAFGLPITELLVFLVHWATPFVAYGTLGSVWMLCWLYYIALKPATDTRISEGERKYIESSIGPVSTVKVTISSTPWFSIFTSMPVWAIVVANFARCWTMFLLVQHQLTYLRMSLHLDVIQTGISSMLPHVIMGIVVILGGQLADRLLTTNKLSTTNVRKLMNIIGFGSEAVLLLALSFVTRPLVALVLMVVAIAVSGFAISGFNVNHLDIAPRYAAALMALSNGLGALAGVVCPIVTEQLIETHGHTVGWQYVFMLAAAVHFVGVTFYTLFASGTKQKWAEPDNKGGDDKAEGKALDVKSIDVVTQC